MAGWRRTAGVMGIAGAVWAMACQTAWAGSWQQGQDGWVYESEGASQEQPAINRENAPYLLENILIREGLYQDEDEELEYRVTYDTKDVLTITVGWEDRPGVFRTICTFEMDKSRKTARSLVTKKEYAVY